MINSSLFFVCIFGLLGSIHGHGRLIQPPSRASAWRYGFNTPPDYNDNQGFCGGFDYQFNTAEGKCGICGDPWYANPREHEAPEGRYATGTITESYNRGETINVQIDITANHRGFFEFRLCPNNPCDNCTNNLSDPSQECFDRNVLSTDTGSTEWKLPDEKTRIYDVNLKLPDDITCTHCILQWTYITGNSWGIDENGQGCVGCGRRQEHFRACADVRITDDTP